MPHNIGHSVQGEHFCQNNKHTGLHKWLLFFIYLLGFPWQTNLQAYARQGRSHFQATFGGRQPPQQPQWKQMQPLQPQWKGSMITVVEFKAKQATQIQLELQAKVSLYYLDLRYWCRAAQAHILAHFFLYFCKKNPVQNKH